MTKGEHTTIGDAVAESRVPPGNEEAINGDHQEVCHKVRMAR
jgi:hypothetical protein